MPPRPRLSERLDRGAASKLMLVSAPAGFGKTTLLAGWLAAIPAAPTDERSVAWVSLDRGDNHPATFWTYVIGALRTVRPAIGTASLTALSTSPPPPIAVAAHYAGADASLVNHLHDYFPDAVMARLPSQVDEHPLRAEIIATVLANHVVNRNGSTFVFRLVDETQPHRRFTSDQTTPA